jgi:hypothetical protein
MEVNTAYENALALRNAGRDRLRDSYRRHRQVSSGDIRVVLLGRPYTVLSREMNKHIPDIFAALGIKVFYQDMLDPAAADLETVKPLLDEIHWEHAAEILKAAVVAAQTESLYPVLLTSFMCTPDSFVMDYFRRIMDLHGKPYLILQIDEHGSSVGYETRIEAVDISEEPRRSQVAIFGDLYVRDNRFINQNLIRFIERNGGEVITTPYSTYARMIAGPYFRKWFREGKYWHTFSSRALMSSVQWMERRYYRHFERVLREPEQAFRDDPAKILAGYHLGIEHTGESMDNILKVHYIRKHYPDVALFVQTNPAFCCPSIVTQAMSRKIEENTGVPVVSITYDGTGSFKNSKIIPYLAYPRKQSQSPDRRLVSVR